jgi:signal transduction histidine kinase
VTNIGRTRSLLAELTSSQWTAIRDALDEVGDLLRRGGLTAAEPTELGERLVSLAEHPKWEVRKAVAHAVLYLRHVSFEAAIARLVDDDNAWVKDAAQRTLARRSELTKADLLKDQHGDLMLRWLADLEALHGTRARNAAMRVAEKFVELIVREAHHEIVKVIAPMDVSLTNLENSLSRVRIDRKAVLRHVHRAQDRLKLLNAVVRSLRDLHTEVTPEFRGENLRSMTDEAVELVRDRMPDRPGGIAVSIEIDPGLVIDAHRHRLLQAFSNILQNGAEAHDGLDRPVELRVTARTEENVRVVMEFIDAGCGMSSEAQADAFQLFSTKKPNGTGFGLPLARKIIEAEHGGSMTLSSTKNVGTVVRVVLPVEQEERDG